MDHELYRSILGMRVDFTTYRQAVDTIFRLILNEKKTYVCVANVHMVMEAYDNSEFQQIINHAGLVTPDGVPLVWVLKLLGIKNAERVYGPRLTMELCNEAARRRIPVGFYGGTHEVLQSMTDQLKKSLPSLKVVYKFSPPFRPLTHDEETLVAQDVTESGVKLLFVGLGCPKQEKWMAVHTESFPAVLIGVGAAFDFIAKKKPQAPEWLQLIGMEWMFRLISEPRRLWKRYLYHNPRFVLFFLLQLILTLINKRKKKVD
ncbi:WecB/TagA/CpsF family glycosyltransferase [bacterium]|nr:MAG: WecB/TagA/CpsF family glycosyltransferase [bacterium]